MHTPLNRSADTPEDPLTDLNDTLVPMNVMPLPIRSPDTLAQKRDSFYTPEEALANDKNGAGPTGMLTEPGGNDYVAGMSDSSTGTGMQYSKEGTKTYSGNEVRGKVIKGDDKHNLYG